MAALIFTIIVGLWSPLYAFLDECVDPRTTRNTRALELVEEFDRRVTIEKSYGDKCYYGTKGKYLIT